MAVKQFTGHHVDKPGRPGDFRTTGGRLFAAGAAGVKLESLFSRKSETANLNAMQQQHAEAVGHFDSKKNSTIHITNNTDHIERLNEGWSQQTTPGFFERSLLEAKKAILGNWRLKAVP